MRLAAARAGLWFFGTIIFVFVIFGSYFKDTSTVETIVWLVFIGLVVGGVIFCKEWHDYEQEERKHRLAERRKALNSTDTRKTP